MANLHTQTSAGFSFRVSDSKSPEIYFWNVALAMAPPRHEKPLQELLRYFQVFFLVPTYYVLRSKKGKKDERSKL